MRKQYLHAVIIVAGILCVSWLCWYLFAPQQEQHYTIDQLRLMLKQGNTPQERARGAAGLGERKHTPSIPLLLAAMEDEDPLLRGQAAVAVEKILGADYFFEPLDPPERRQQALQKYKALWEAWKEKTGYNQELVYPNQPADHSGDSS